MDEELKMGSSRELLPYLKKMIKIRCFEEKILEIYSQGQITGMCHVCIGQEAAAVGACTAITENDFIVSTHRGHGHLLAKGGDPRTMMAELFGKATGCCKGRGGSMHVIDVSLGHLGANGIVGAGIPMACGVALSIKYRNGGQVVLSFFGDGATNQGAFHESLNMAALWSLPVIFVCENNQYAVSTNISKACPTPDVADKADGYGMAKIVVDGMDVLAVNEAVRAAAQDARKGKGPTFIECKTYNFQGHGTSNDRPYRTQEEENEWRQKCPIKKFKDRLIKDKLITNDEYQKIVTETTAMLDEAVKFAQESPWPDPASVGQYVFCE